MPSAPTSPGPPQREYMTRYAREIERELLEGGEVPPPASSFGQNGCIGAWRVGREIGKGASGMSLPPISFNIIWNTRVNEQEESGSRKTPIQTSTQQ